MRQASVKETCQIIADKQIDDLNFIGRFDKQGHICMTKESLHAMLAVAAQRGVNCGIEFAENAAKSKPSTLSIWFHKLFPRNKHAS